MRRSFLASLTAIAGITIVSLPNTLLVHGQKTKLTTNHDSSNELNYSKQQHQQQQALDDKYEKKRRHRERTTSRKNIRKLDSQYNIFLQMLEDDMQQKLATENSRFYDDNRGYHVKAEVGDATKSGYNRTDDEISLKFVDNETTGIFFRKQTRPDSKKSGKSTKAPKSTKSQSKSTTKSKSSKASKSSKVTDLPSYTHIPTSITFSPSPSASVSPFPAINYEPTTSSKKGKGVYKMGKSNQSKKGKKGNGGPNMIGKGVPTMVGKGSSKSNKIPVSDFPSFSHIPSPSFSPIPTTTSPLPPTSFSQLPTQTPQPTLCQSSKKNKSSKSGGDKGMMIRDGKGMVRDGKGMMRDGKGMMRDDKGIMRDDKGIIREGKGMMSSGMRGMMGEGKKSYKEKGSSKNVDDCPEPTFSPSPSIISNCKPTSGTCVRSSISLQLELDKASNRDIVSICDSHSIIVNEALFLTADEMILCCDGVGCKMLGDGSNSLLIVQGRSVTLQGIRFENGFGSNYNGGNVAIQANGDHTIIGCDFINGTTKQAGGNLFVETLGSLNIISSTFVDGVARTVGGGIAVIDAGEVYVFDTTFVNNKAPNGGALYDAVDPALIGRTQNLVVTSSTFISNDAESGGGFFVSELGTLPTLLISSNAFLGNTATEGGGAGAILDGLDNIFLTITSNSGSGNIAAPRLCSDFLTLDTSTSTSTTPNCIAANQEYP